MARLSTKDKGKPFILIGAIFVGILLNMVIGGVMQEIYGLVNVVLFFVIFVIIVLSAISLFFTIGRAMPFVKKLYRKNILLND